MARFNPLSSIAPTGLFARWRHNARVRAELSGLTASTVLDLGLDLDAVRAEAARPFWRPLATDLSAPKGDDPTLMPASDYRFAEVLAAAERQGVHLANDDRPTRTLRLAS